VVLTAGSPNKTEYFDFEGCGGRRVTGRQAWIGHSPPSPNASISKDPPAGASWPGDRACAARPRSAGYHPPSALPPVTQATLCVAAGRDSGHNVLSAEESLKVVVGLGNPGSQYAGTRHNIGWLVMDRLAERAGWDGRGRRRDNSNVVGGRYRSLDLTLVKPLTYMNESGLAVRKVLQREHAPLGDLLIVADDFALPFGKLRFREGGGAGGHNGLGSIIEELGTEKFSRLRIGIGEPNRSAVDHVLTKFAPDEQQRLDELLDAAADAVEEWAREGTSKAANRYNMFELRPADTARLAAAGEVDGPPDVDGIRRTRTGWRRIRPPKAGD
jgi:peptidyl-tRNA hydrolase, PTH1 family